MGKRLLESQGAKVVVFKTGQNLVSSSSVYLNLSSSFFAVCLNPSNNLRSEISSEIPFQNASEERLH